MQGAAQTGKGNLVCRHEMRFLLIQAFHSRNDSSLAVGKCNFRLRALITFNNDVIERAEKSVVGNEGEVKAAWIGNTHEDLACTPPHIEGEATATATASGVELGDIR